MYGIIRTYVLVDQGDAMAKKRRRRQRYELNHCIVSLRLIEKEVKRVRKSLEEQRDQDATSSDSDSASPESQTDSSERP